MKFLLFLSIIFGLSSCSMINNSENNTSSTQSGDTVIDNVEDPSQAVHADDVSNQPKNTEVLENISEQVKIENVPNDTF